MPTFAGENIIYHKTKNIVARKDERNDNDDDRMPSGSKTFERSRKTGSGLSLRADREDCILSKKAIFEACLEERLRLSKV